MASLRTQFHFSSLFPALVATISALGCLGESNQFERHDAAAEDATSSAMKLPMVRLESNASEGALVGFEVEMVTDDVSRTRGLMERRRLGERRGMLFVFDREEEQRFWMKNTWIPLDMIFIGENLKVVGVVHEAEPGSLSPRFVPQPSRYVLEINGGLARHFGIVRGASVDLSEVLERLAD